jgi:hypothetical protein
MTASWTVKTFGAIFVILLVAISPAFAFEQGCKALSTVEVSKLVRIGPEVSCKRQGPGPTPEVCKYNATLVEDRMLGASRRLIVVSPSEGGNRYDEIHVFACSGGQVKEVLDTGGELGTKVAYAAPDKIVISVAPEPLGKSGSNSTFNWVPELNRYCIGGYQENEFLHECPDDILPAGDTFFSYSDFPDHISCDSLKTMKAEALAPIQADCWESSDSKNCHSGVSIIYDQMVGDDRRAVAVRGIAPAQGRDVSFVFGCVSGRVRVLFAAEGAKIESVSAGKLTLQAPILGGGALCCPEGSSAMTYAWDANLKRYVLTDILYTSARETSVRERK